MKNNLIIVLVAAIALFGVNANAQTAPKLGFTDVDLVLNFMPESKKIQNEIGIQRQQYEKAIQDKSKDFEERVKDYEKKASTMPDLLRQDTEKQLQSLQASIQELNTKSQQDLQNKYNVLLGPVMNKIDEAIKAVGKENGFLFIFNLNPTGQTPIILYSSSEENDVTKLVLKKLGIDPTVIDKAKEAAAAAAAPKATTPAAAPKPAATTPAAPKKN